MRKVLVTVIAALGMLSFSQSASAFCGPQSPWASHITCGPLAGHGGGYHGHHRGYAINGLYSATPYAIRMPPGPLDLRIAYWPPVTGYSVQRYHTQSYHAQPYATQGPRMCHDWERVNGVKIYTRHYAC